MRAMLLAACTAAVVLVPATSEAQQPTRRRTQAIEIRGQVPTPQVVTVRPREVPTYSRQVISPNFYDRDFWSSILPGYQVVSQRMLTGAVSAGDSAAAGSTPGTPGTTPGTTPQGMTVAPPPSSTPMPNVQRTMPTQGTTTPADTTRGSGTPPARTPR